MCVKHMYTYKKYKENKKHNNNITKKILEMFFNPQ